MSKFYLYLLIFAFALPAAALAQDASEDEDESIPDTAAIDESRPEMQPPDHVRTKWGVFGNIHSGVTFGSFGSLEDDLKTEQLFRDNFALSSLGTNVGGDVNVQIGHRLIIGFGGTRFDYHTSLAGNQNYQPPASDTIAPTEPTEFGESRIHSYFFDAKIGFCIFNKTRYKYDKDLREFEYKYRWMLYPYIGLGFGNETLMEVSNYSLDREYFGPSDDIEAPGAIPRSEYREFTTALTMLEIGVATRFLKNKRGGLMLGAELGGYFNLGDGTWENSDLGVEIPEVNPAGLSGVYLRVTAGGGFFQVDDPSFQAVEDGYVDPDALKEE